MTDLEQSLLIGGSIFVVMMASQYGRRDYTWHKVVMPVASCAVFAYFYLKDAPTMSVDFVVYAVGGLIGLVFGVWASVATGVERDARDGKVYTRCGAGFALAFLTCLALRVAFIASAQHVGPFRDRLGAFMFDHKIVVDAIPPFFVIMACAMVVSRVAFIAGRVAALPQRAAIKHPQPAAAV